MTKLRTNILMIVGLILCAVSYVDAEPYTVYMVVWRGCEEACKGFQDYFREEKIDADIVVRDAERNKSRLPDFVREAKQMNADLVITWGTSVTVGMVGTINDYDPERHITEIPVVFMIVADPIGAGIIESYTTSGRLNITGTRNRVPEEVQMKAIRSYRHFKRLGILYNSNELNSLLNLEKIRNLAAEMQFDLIERSVDLDKNGKPDIASVPQKVSELKSQEVEFIYVGSSSFLMRNRDYVTQSALDQGVPMASAYEAMAKTSNALLAVASRYYSVGKLAGFQAKQILIDKNKPIDLPVLSLSRYSYVINMETARKLKLYPPIALLRYAEIVHRR
jgi:putative ABC transport system substrate-binding protein